MTDSAPMPPPPEGVDGLARLRGQLRQLRLRAGEPSTRVIAARAGHPISHTTVAAVLRCATPPRWAQLEVVVAALDGDVEEFRQAWMAMRSNREPIRQVAPGAQPIPQDELSWLRDEVARLRTERDERQEKLEHQARMSRFAQRESMQGHFEGRPTSGPTVLQMIVGAQLRNVRSRSGISQEDAGWEIRSSSSKIARMELGRVRFKERDIADLLTLYGTTDTDEREAILALARRASSSDWWHRHYDPLPPSFSPYLVLEQQAKLIRTYEMRFVPGLLQTPEYARAVFSAGHPGASKSEIDRRVKLRMDRKRWFDGRMPAHLWGLIDESVLLDRTVDRATMKEQIAALVESTERRNVQLQLLSRRTPQPTSFTVLRFPEPDLPDVVYIELAAAALYLDRRPEVEIYAISWEQAAIAAESIDATRDRLTAVYREL